MVPWYAQKNAYVAEQCGLTKLALRGGFVAEIGTVVSGIIFVPKTLGQEHRRRSQVVCPN